MMTAERLAAFLGATDPPHLGVVATLRSDGSPALTPVWYRWDGRKVAIWSGEERRWVQNLRRDSRVAFSVQDERPPYAAVVMRGHATMAAGEGSNIVEAIRLIARRYLDEERVDAYIEEWPTLRTVVTIEPDKIASWESGG